MNDKERLENMSPLGFDLNGNILLKSEDYHWLMEQAERVEELKLDIEKQKNRKYIKMRQRDDFIKKAQRYREYLELIKTIGTYGKDISTGEIIRSDEANLAEEALESEE